jgi:hypothetical protein
MAVAIDPRTETYVGLAMSLELPHYATALRGRYPEDSSTLALSTEQRSLEDPE